MSEPHLLVIGTGSAGRRHARNMIELEALVSCMDPRLDRLEQVRDEIPPLLGTYTSLEEALDQADALAGAVVASPPSFHVDQAIACLDIGLPVLMEKPLSPDLASARRLRDAMGPAAPPVLLGYTYRWWPPFLQMRRRVLDGAVGTPRHARFVMSAHLADWHPWERYQDFFMASSELGGGALLDESHFLDLAIWFFGMPTSIGGRVEHLSSLDISSDDNVDALLVFNGGLRVTIHLDLYGRPHEKRVTVAGEDGTLDYSLDTNVLRYSRDAEGDWEESPFDCERNDMFLGVARDFLAAVDGRAAPTCTVQDGVEVLRCVEALRSSTSSGRSVELAEVC